MNNGDALVCVATIIFVGKIWTDIVDVWKYKIRIRTCLQMVQDAAELLERYSNPEKNVR